MPLEAEALIVTTSAGAEIGRVSELLVDQAPSLEAASRLCGH